MVELGLLSAGDQAEIVQAEYEGYSRNALVQLRRVREGTQIEEDHMRNRQMIVQWIIANSKAIEVRKRDGKTYYAMVDVKAYREAVGRLLAETQRIKAEGDYEAARKLFETYGVHFDPKLRDQVVVERTHVGEHLRVQLEPAGEAVVGALHLRPNRSGRREGTLLGRRLHTPPCR
jgi:dipeptidyl-peptidase-3